jgi:hypothetical protein
MIDGNMKVKIYLRFLSPLNYKHRQHFAFLCHKPSSRRSIPKSTMAAGNRGGAMGTGMVCTAQKIIGYPGEDTGVTGF